MFEVHESWNVTIPPLLSEDAQTKVYKCVRIILQMFHFIVEFDVDCGENDGIYRKTVILNSVNDVIAAVGEFDNYTVSLLIPSRLNNNEIAVSTVIEIIEGKEDNQTAYIYICKNGNNYVQTDLGYNIDQIYDKKTVYLSNNM
jgi:hypothetical protein